MESRVAFIIPYFGKLPAYFQLFVNSVEGKPFDVYFFSDCQVPANLPVNFKPVPFTFAQVKELFVQKLDFPVKLEKPYKLCDLKPTLGYVFSDYLAGYEFWGSIDIDTIVGDFGKFITNEVLDQIDFYSGVKQYVSGSFFLVRNEERFNRIFLKSKDWKRVSTEEKNFAFDECGGRYHQQLKAGANIFDLHTEIQSFTELIFLEVNNGLRARFTDDILEPGGFDYVTVNNYSVNYRRREYLLVHFIYYKTRYYFYINPVVDDRDYYVSELGTFNRPLKEPRLYFSINALRALGQRVKRLVDKFSGSRR